MAPRHIINLTVRKKLANNRILLTASTNNLFNRFNEYASRIEAYTSQNQYESGSTGRHFKVSLTWNFNSGKRIRKQTIERSSESERERLNKK